MPRSPEPAPHHAAPTTRNLDGALIIDKPQGKTSHDIVAEVRHIAGLRQVGHLGTLDPLATGVLVLLLGRATRLAQFYSGRRKRYLATIRFGFATDTYDAEGKAAGSDSAPMLNRKQVESMAAKLTGRFPQMPPPYSAKKIGGKAAYELARKNKPVELKAVEIEVYEFRVEEIEGSRARVAIECAAGTYIRSLAHDMGREFGCGAHLEKICRTAVGEFTLDQAAQLDQLAAAAKEGSLANYVLPLENLLHELPSITVPPLVEKSVRHGAKFNIVPAQVQPGRVAIAQGAPAELDSGEWKPARIRVFNSEEKLIAIAEAIVPRTYQPVVVLAAEP
jgi:tRNA pseudouridine55 synthase